MAAYCLGIVHAPPGTDSYSRLPTGYALNRDELRVLAHRIPGSPLTVEHNGIHEAVDRAAKKAAAAPTVSPRLLCADGFGEPPPLFGETDPQPVEIYLTLPARRTTWLRATE